MKAIELGSTSWFALNSTSSTLFQKLTDSKWMDIYNNKHISDHGDVYLVIDRFAFDTVEPKSNMSMKDYWNGVIAGCNQTKIRDFTYESPPWIDYKQFTRLAGREVGDDETWPVSAHVTHSFARIVESQSRIQLSLYFMVVVIIFNFIKLFIMLWVLINDDSEYIVTLGDAVASFLEYPDPTTNSMCMLGKEEMLWKIGYRPYHEPEGEDSDTLNLRLGGVWLPQSLRYFASVTKDRQAFYAIL